AYDIALAQQIKANAPGAKVMLDFHYSDTWADPSKQFIPAAWSGQTLSQLETSVTNYTQSTLQSFYDAGVMPDIVQLGNETTGGIMWPTGQLNFTGTVAQQNASWAAYGGLLNAGIAGVRNVQSANGLSRIPVSLSIDKGDKDGQPQYHYQYIQSSTTNPIPFTGGKTGGGVTDFDIEGVDFYSSSVSGITTMKNNLTALANTNTNNGLNTNPSKRIMLLETNWPNGSGSSGYTGPTTWPKTPAGQEQEAKDVRNLMLSLPGGDGEGVLWWYPESVRVSGSTGYQNGVTALFDNTSNHAAEPAIIDNVFAPIRGDFNSDGHFNAADIGAMLNALVDLSTYQKNTGFTNPDMKFLGDFNGDGVVTNADLQGLVTSLINGGGSTDPVPEPSTAWLMVIGTVALLRHRLCRQAT
ncbi:MAG TPA: glycosyl hydrolase 53 family protein, partial [Pirellulales bacterium]